MNKIKGISHIEEEEIKFQKKKTTQTYCANIYIKFKGISVISRLVIECLYKHTAGRNVKNVISMKCRLHYVNYNHIPGYNKIYIRQLFK